MLDDLKSWYKSNVVSRIEALEAAKQDYANNPEESINSILRIAHSLKGSGATYGFQEISKAAEAVETAPKETILESLDMLLAILHTLCDQKNEINQILIIEDDADISHLLELVLSNQNNHCLVTHSATEAQNAINNTSSIDIILLDLGLPDMDGRNFIVKLRENPKTAMVPIIVLSARIGKQFESECFVLGADAYYTKPFDPKVLSTAVKNQLDKTSHSSRLPFQDSLTDLPNRAAIRNHFDKIISNNTSNSSFSITLVLLDIDYMGQINEKYGQKNGNKIILQVATFIKENALDGLFAARWESDSFLLLFTNISEQTVFQWITKIKESLVNTPVSFDSGDNYTASFSAAVIEFKKLKSFDETLQEMEELLYFAKSSGRNCILTPTQKQKPIRKQLLLADDDELAASIIKHRLSREGFDVHHAPDGEKALQMAQSHPYTLVILDVKMPVYDGFELLKLLRNLPAYKKTPIIMLTSMGEEKDIVRGLNLGADDYMLKPFSPIELVARIRRVLKQ